MNPCLSQLLQCCFSDSSIPSMLISWYSSINKSFSSSLFENHGRLMYSFKQIYHNALPSLFFLMLKLSQIGWAGTPSLQVICPFDTFPLNTSLPSHIASCSRLSCTSRPQTSNQPFSQNGPYVWTVLGCMSEWDHESQLKYNMTEFFFSLPHCTFVSGVPGSQQRQWIYLLCPLIEKKLLFSFTFFR